MEDEDHAERVRRGVEHREKVVQLRHRLDEHLLLRLQVCEQFGELASARHLLDRSHYLLQPPLHRGRQGHARGCTHFADESKGWMYR